MRHSIENPNPVLEVRASFSEEEALREVGAACELELAGLILLGVRGELMEALPIFRRCSHPGRVGIEPGEEPRMNVGRFEPDRLNPGIRKAADQALAGGIQYLLGAASGRSPARASIDDEPHAAGLPPPGELRDRGVVKEPARLSDRLQVMLHQPQVLAREHRSLGARMHIGMQRFEARLPTGLILKVKLNHPWVLLELLEAVLERVLEGIARLLEPGRLSPLGAEGGELEERRHRFAVIEKEAL